MDVIPSKPTLKKLTWVPSSARRKETVCGVGRGEEVSDRRKTMCRAVSLE